MDKDFGELVFKRRVSHCGIILIRLEDERIDSKIAVLDRFLANFSEPISPQHFIVLTEKTMRITLTQ